MAGGGGGGCRDELAEKQSVTMTPNWLSLSSTSESELLMLQ